MFAALGFGDLELQAWGHVGVLLTGLKKASCFLHFVGDDKSYIRKHFAGENHVGNLRYRVCIPSREDGNADGVSELGALDCWRLYKHLLFNAGRTGGVYPAWQDEWGYQTRREIMSARYNQPPSFSSIYICSTVATDLLNAACDGRFGAEGVEKAAVWSGPMGFMRHAISVRRKVLQAIQHNHRLPIYGPVLEYSLMKKPPRDETGRQPLTAGDRVALPTAPQDYPVISEETGEAAIEACRQQRIWPCYTPICEGWVPNKVSFTESAQGRKPLEGPPVTNWKQAYPGVEDAQAMFDDRNEFLNDGAPDRGDKVNRRPPKFHRMRPITEEEHREEVRRHVAFARLTGLGIRPFGLVYSGV